MKTLSTFLMFCPALVFATETGNEPTETQYLILQSMTLLGVILISLSVWNFIRNKKKR